MNSGRLTLKVCTSDRATGCWKVLAHHVQAIGSVSTKARYFAARHFE
jgi:hypothetical protein